MNSRCLLLKGKDYFPVRTMFGKKNAAVSDPGRRNARSRLYTSLYGTAR